MYRGADVRSTQNPVGPTLMLELGTGRYRRFDAFMGCPYTLIMIHDNTQ